MNSRIISVVSMFVVSLLVGYNMFPTAETVQAQPVIPSPIEMPQLNRNLENKSVEKVDITYNLETQEVSVTGTTDAIVNFTTVGEQKPIVKWKTRVIKEEKNSYPYVKNISKISENEMSVSPKVILENHEK